MALARRVPSRSVRRWVLLGEQFDIRIGVSLGLVDLVIGSSDALMDQIECLRDFSSD